MSYLAPSEFVTKMVDAGESKIFMSTRDTVIRAFMAGAILALAAWFAVTINVNTGQPIIGALLFPVGFCMLYLLGFDLLTGVFVLSPLAWLDKRPGVTIGGVLRNWGLVFIGNFLWNKLDDIRGYGHQLFAGCARQLQFLAEKAGQIFFRQISQLDEIGPELSAKNNLVF